MGTAQIGAVGLGMEREMTNPTNEQAQYVVFVNYTLPMPAEG